MVNTPIFDLDEQLLGIADLFDPETGLVAEFDGQEHRLRRRHRADNLREEKLEAANLVVCRVDSLDLRYPVPLASGFANDTLRDSVATVAATTGPWSSRPGGNGGGHREAAWQRAVAKCPRSALLAAKPAYGECRAYSLVAKAASKDGGRRGDGVQACG